jgi:two-component system chemotaxis response regulator CheB
MPIRVLIVDDSVVVRKILSEELATDPSIEVAGLASSGYLALAKIPQLSPDLVTLDIEMPGMNGLETLAQIRKLYPKLPVVMFSTLTERGASATLEALALGASDYACKPTNSGSMAGARETIRKELIHKIKSLIVKPFHTHLPLDTLHPAPRNSQQRVDVVAIGTSTGGPNALAEVIPFLPADFPVPVLIVQHMPPLFTRLLAERLDSRSYLSVREGEAGQVLAPEQVWIARGDYHMTVERKGTEIVLALDQRQPENSCRPAVDVLFSSVANTYGSYALGLVMTGMGSDGARGASHMRQAGSGILVQDEATSVVWGMPGAVVGAGAADKICPLSELSQEIVRRVTSPRMSVATLSK